MDREESEEYGSDDDWVPNADVELNCNELTNTLSDTEAPKEGSLILVSQGIFAPSCSQDGSIGGGLGGRSVTKGSEIFNKLRASSLRSEDAAPHLQNHSSVTPFARETSAQTDCEAPRSIQAHIFTLPLDIRSSQVVGEEHMTPEGSPPTGSMLQRCNRELSPRGAFQNELKLANTQVKPQTGLPNPLDVDYDSSTSVGASLNTPTRTPKQGGGSSGATPRHTASETTASTMNPDRLEDGLSPKKLASRIATKTRLTRLGSVRNKNYYYSERSPRSTDSKENSSPGAAAETPKASKVLSPTRLFSKDLENLKDQKMQSSSFYGVKDKKMSRKILSVTEKIFKA